MAAIARFGTRVVPDLQEIIQDCRQGKQLVQGPHIEAFEREFAQFLGTGHVRTCSTEYGRMALYFILKAMNLPPGSEIIVPALTFWVVPEIARVAGLTPVFADIDPITFTLCPQAVERAITPKTVAVLPTHLYGLSCDMDPILDLARRHDLKVIEDCAHSLGAMYEAAWSARWVTRASSVFRRSSRSTPMAAVWPGLVTPIWRAAWVSWPMLRRGRARSGSRASCGQASGSTPSSDPRCSPIHCFPSGMPRRG